MKTLFAQILVWLLATIVITSAGFFLIMTFSDPAPGQAPTTRLVLDEARYMYSTQGTGELAAYLERVRSGLTGAAIFTDSRGRDPLTGKDYAGLVEQASRTRLPFVRGNSGFYLFSTDQQGNWIFLERRWTPGAQWFWRLWPLVVILGVCYLLARHLTAPLRGLEHAVERFGNGDWSARVSSKRRDELGQLTRTFDQMAERIQSLLETQRTLLRDISHELRSPLTRLGLCVELARSGSDKGQALDRIEQEADRLNALVEELLSLARIDSQHVVRTRSAVRVDEMLDDLIDVCSVEASARDCRLVLERCGAVTVEADEELLRRAVENVIRNAVRYAPAHTDVTLSIDQRDDITRILVRDGGGGVPTESLAKIFEPFYRVDSDRNRDTGGVGLGLAIAYRAAAIHGGTIVARNANPGLEVELQLPHRAGSQSHTIR